MNTWICTNCGQANSIIFSTCEKCKTFREDKEKE